MKILILNSILYTPNGEVHRVKSIKDTMIYNMCIGFKANGHDITLAAAEEYEPIEDRNYDFEVLFFKSVMRSLFKPRALPFSLSLARYLIKNHHKFELVISSEVFSFPSLFAALICKKKTVIWHELALHPSFFFKLPSKFWYNIVCKLFIKNVLVIPRSISSRKFIMQYCNRVSPICVEHGINLDKFEYSREKNNYFTYVGQLIPRKNVEYIINVFAQYIFQTKNDVKLILCGNGSSEESLHRHVKKLGIEDKVEFKGKLNHLDLNKTIMMSHGCLIATKQDNNMVSIPESIVSGTPILTNTIPTNSYIIKEEYLGIVKDNWGTEDLQHIFNNSVLVDNCIAYRDKLSTKYTSQMIVTIFNKQNN